MWYSSQKRLVVAYCKKTHLEGQEKESSSNKTRTLKYRWICEHFRENSSQHVWAVEHTKIPAPVQQDFSTWMMLDEFFCSATIPKCFTYPTHSMGLAYLPPFMVVEKGVHVGQAASPIGISVSDPFDTTSALRVVRSTGLPVEPSA